MIESKNLNHPLLVAVWPGMGNVAVSAGYYLIAKLGMHLLSEYTADELFDIDHVEVQDGVIQPSRMPRNRFFVWIDPAMQRDVIVFIGEAQPPIGKHQFCLNLIEYAKSLGVKRVVTFAAMASQMRPEQASRVFCAATDPQTLETLKRANLTTLDNGNIGGLNGVLLAAAMDRGLPGSCLLGEMPHIFAQLPYPKGSLAVVKAFVKMTHIEVDLRELTEQAQQMDEQLGALLVQMEAAIVGQEQQEEEQQDEDQYSSDPAEDQLSSADERRIESLFRAAREDQSRAYELKRELDQLGVFEQYEDRFLDLFKKPE